MAPRYSLLSLLDVCVCDLKSDWCVFIAFLKIDVFMVCIYSITINRCVQLASCLINPSLKAQALELGVTTSFYQTPPFYAAKSELSA